MKKLASESEISATFFEHGTLSLEVYCPDKQDFQQFHDRDEVYIIMSGYDFSTLVLFYGPKGG